jgi:hypothetical protein
MTCEGSRLYLRKDNGLVRDVFRQSHMLRLRGNMGIGHVRYPTAGCESSAEAQPFYVNSPYGVSLAHNGNLTNADGAQAGPVPRRPAPHQHQFRLGDPAQRLRPRAAAPGQAAHRRRRCLRGRGRRAPPLQGRLCRRGHDHGLWHHGLPRSLRHPPAGVWQARDGPGHGIHGGLRERGAGCAGFRTGARPGAPARRSGRRWTARAQPASARRTPSTPLHLRIRLPGPAGFHHRRCLGLQGAPAHGREAGGEDPARWPDHDIDVVIPIPDTSRTARCSWPTVWA